MTEKTLSSEAFDELDRICAAFRAELEDVGWTVNDHLEPRDIILAATVVVESDCRKWISRRVTR